jgi:hypothetical protein
VAERTLTVRIVGDDSSLQRTFQRDAAKTRQAASGVEGLGRNFIKAGAAAGIAAVGFHEVVSAVGSSIQAASDLNEEISKSSVIFGDSAGEISDWSKTTASSLGISRTEALRATGTFGQLFKVLGFVDAENAEMSKSLVQLAADMASFSNADPSDVLLSIRSGLVGEAEPLRRFGVFLSEARVQQNALAETGKKNVKSLTDQEKAQARYNIILADTVAAQGDVDRTADSLANQQRRLGAEFQDLSASMGAVLLPTFLEAIRLANLLFTALDKFRGVDFSPGFDFPDPPSWLSGAALAPISPLGAGVLIAHDLFADDKKNVDALTAVTNSVNQSLGQLATALGKRGAALAKANRAEHRREVDAFDAFLKGMGLKLDIAGLSASEADDLAVLRETEAAIERRIAREGRTFKLASELTRVRGQIADKTASIASDSAQSSRDAFDAILDALDLKLDIAETTRTFNDDIRILRQIETQILRRIEAEGRTTDLMRRLFENRQAQAQALRDQRNAAQFERLGLTAEGEERVASRRALRRRANRLEDRIEGTILDTAKTRRTLDRIQAVLSGKFGEVGREVRQSILGMLDDISSALESGDKPAGPLTKFAKTGIGKLIAGLNLTTEQERELFARMSAVGPGFSIPRSGTGAFGMGVPSSAQVGPRRGPREADFEVHIYIDGEEVESRVTRRQQRKQGRNARSRRGVRPGR